MDSKDKNILVGIIMGSQSDWEVMKEAKDQLDEFSISNEQFIISAHRTPKRILNYAKKVMENGVKSYYCRCWRCSSFAWYDGISYIFQ